MFLIIFPGLFLFFWNGFCSLFKIWGFVGFCFANRRTKKSISHLSTKFKPMSISLLVFSANCLSQSLWLSFAVFISAVNETDCLVSILPFCYCVRFKWQNLEYFYSVLHDLEWFYSVLQNIEYFYSITRSRIEIQFVPFFIMFY